MSFTKLAGALPKDLVNSFKTTENRKSDNNWKNSNRFMTIGYMN